MGLVQGQAEAISTHDRALIVEAGAGTGKTYTLVQRFLHLLEIHPDWALDSLVAVTFTEKAAREMRTRLRQQIEEKARQSPLASTWREHWRSLEQLQVSTIHGLCARLLRENAIAAGLDPRFEVLDESSVQPLQQEAIRQGLAELVAADDPALALLSSLTVYDLRAELLRLLDQRGVVQRVFDQLAAKEVLLENWRAALAEMRHEEWQEQQASQPELLAAVQRLPLVIPLDDTDVLADTVNLAQQGCHLLAQGDLAGANRLWMQIKLKGGKQVNWGGVEALQQLKTDLRLLQSVAKDMEKTGCLMEMGTADEQAAAALQHWATAWRYVITAYDRLKDERQALDFDDLELHTERLLHQHPIDARLQSFLDHLNQLMVDEFQDTNEVQQRIVYALAHPASGGRLFLVGDAKQSIYRFRQAQVSVFNRTAAEIQRLTGYPPVRLDRSFRSHQAICAAQNSLFERLLRPMAVEYADYEARPGSLQAERPAPVAHPAAPSAVEIWQLPAKDAQEQPLHADDARLLEARWLAERLIELNDHAFPVWDKHSKQYRPFQYSDAAILFRATTSLPLYEEQFKAAGLPYLTISGRGYFDRPEVRDLINLLKALHNPADDLSLAAVLRSPIFGLNDETLYQLRRHTPSGAISESAISLQEALTNPPPTAQALQVDTTARILAVLWALSGRTDPWRLLRRALDLTGYEAALALSDLELGGSGRQRSNLLKFLDVCRQHGTQDLARLLSNLHDFSTREAREGEALAAAPESGAVTLMSIHAAKGLEFPVVVVADLGRRQQRSGASPMILHDPAIGLVCKSRDEDGEWQEPASYVWGKKVLERMEAAESKRLLYVACTRAADLLILSGRASNQESWYKQILNAWQIEPGDQEEMIQSYNGFSVRLLQPTAVTAAPASKPPEHMPAPALQHLPPLAQPLLPLPVERHYAVTQLQRMLEAAPGGMAGLRLAVRPPDAQDGTPRAPQHLVGRLMHRLLADWHNLSLPQPELEKRLTAWAQSEGIRHPQAARHAVGRCMRMLQHLKRTLLFDEIEAALQRQQEIPFTLALPFGQLHGVIDVLYQDQAGQWQLVDWKTDWFPPQQLVEQAQQHRQQIAIYRLATRQALGVEPTASICFLALQAKTYPYSPQELQEATDALLA